MRGNCVQGQGYPWRPIISHKTSVLRGFICRALYLTVSEDGACTLQGSGEQVSDVLVHKQVSDLQV
jgi:hypothetical protein